MGVSVHERVFEWVWECISVWVCVWLRVSEWACVRACDSEKDVVHQIKKIRLIFLCAWEWLSIWTRITFLGFGFEIGLEVDSTDCFDNNLINSLKGNLSNAILTRQECDRFISLETRTIPQLSIRKMFRNNRCFFFYLPNLRTCICLHVFCLPLPQMAWLGFFYLTPLLRLGIKVTSVQLHLLEGP